MYKNYISLGYFCSIALDLGKLGLRKCSYPFDWLISDFKGVISSIENKFSNFLDYDNLAQNKKNLAYFKDLKYNFEFYHDFESYVPLDVQLINVKQKFNRRIDRFFEDITEPTLFIRYICSENLLNNECEELKWIEENLDFIKSVIKKFNINNEILFIANEGLSSNKIKIYNVKRDRNDAVCRNPIIKNKELNSTFVNLSFPNKKINIQRYKRKLKPTVLKKVCKKVSFVIKKLFKKEYVHFKQY